MRKNENKKTKRKLSKTKTKIKTQRDMMKSKKDRAIITTTNGNHAMHHRNKPETIESDKENYLRTPSSINIAISEATADDNFLVTNCQCLSKKTKVNIP